MKKINILICTFLLLFTSLVSCRERCPDGNYWETMNEEQDQMRALINDARADAGVPELENTILGLVAIDHSKDMACQDFFSHINPDGENPADRVENGLGDAYEPPYVWISENIGTHPTAREQFDSWMASDGHRDNILDDRVTE